MQTYKKLFFILNPDERKKAVYLLIMIIIAALLDVIGIASILPFMTVLTNPGYIETNIILKSIFEFSKRHGIENNEEFLFLLGFIVLLLLIFSLIFKALTYYVQVRFVYMREYSVGKRLIEKYLHQPYRWFLNRNSADLGKNILSETSQIISSGMYPLLELISKSILTIILLAFLININAKVTLGVIFSLGCIYLFIFYSIKKILNRIGESRFKNNQLRYTSINEAFGAVKEIKLSGLEEIYIKKFSNYAKNYAKTYTLLRAIGQTPRFILEAIAFGGVLSMMLYIMSTTGSLNNSLPIISLFVFAGYRLIPSLQQIYSSFTQLTFVRPAINKIYSDFKSLKPLNKNFNQNSIKFNKSIELKNIHYNYPKSSRTVLKNVNLTIPANSTIGLVGPTGCGKTTLVDIILGILEPQKGTLEVDEKIITDNNRRSWQSLFGYVPQNIYLADDTIAANIAFGEKPEEINLDLVEKSSKLANLHEFIINELTHKYQTNVGERGVKLSGGQRQRIGIARALYHNPKILVLDEATSALDNQTEEVVMEAINNFEKNMTIIIIAHRINTLKACHKILELDKGIIVEKKYY